MTIQATELPLAEAPQTLAPQELTLDQAATVAGGPVVENDGA